MFPFATCMCFKESKWIAVEQISEHGDKQVNNINFACPRLLKGRQIYITACLKFFRDCVYPRLFINSTSVALTNQKKIEYIQILYKQSNLSLGFIIHGT